MGWEGAGKQLWMPGPKGGRSGFLERSWQQPKMEVELACSGFARRQEAVLLSWLEAGMAPESWAHLSLVFMGSFSSSPEAGGSWSSTLGPTGDACMGYRGSSCPALASSKANKSLVTVHHAGHPPARCRSHPHKWPSSLCQPLV